MPPLSFSPRDLKAIDQLRAKEVKLQDKVVATEVKISQTQDKLDELQRLGADDVKLQQMQDTIAKLANGRDTLRDQITAVRDNIGVIHDRLPDPNLEAMIPNFRADTPILMLPVRLETRYFDTAQSLRLRVFPDQAHIDNHVTELTADEIAAGQFYWQERWTAVDGADELHRGTEAFAALARQFRPRRAAWIAYAMTPVNLTPPPRVAAPEFPAATQRADAWSRAAFATLLPTRWVAVGYRDDAKLGLQRLFQKSSGPTRDRLNTGLDPHAQTDPALDADGIATEVPIDAGLKWISDFAEAEAAGMALRITDADFDATERTAGRTLANTPIARLVVYGINPTLTPEVAVQRLNALIAAHVFSDGLEVLTPGTPTNNSDASASGLDRSDVVAIAAMDPQRSAPTGSAAMDTLAAALGIDPVAAQSDRLPGGAMADAVTTGHLINALWSATLGQTLDQLFDPALSDDDLGRLRDHAVAHLRPGGALPAVRIGSQPYGILPVVAADGYKSADAVEENLVRAIGAVRGIWSRAATKAPTIARAGHTLAENMEALLQQGPMAASNSFRRVYGPSNAKNANVDRALSATQERTRSLIFKALGLKNKMPINGMTAEARQHRLGAPFVQAKLDVGSEPLVPNYISDMAAEAAKSNGRAALLKRGNANTLLEALLSHAALYELDRAAALVVHQHQKESAGIKMPARAALRIDEMIAVDPPVLKGDLRVNQALVQSPADQARLILPERTGSKPLISYVIDQLFDQAGRDRAAVERYQSVLDSLGYLAQRPARELDRLTRGCLDAYTYRLDAWISSLAHKRLAYWRAKPASKGISVGGWAWVENLRPDRRPDSEGYIHAPSLQQAQTAAVLRSGHLAHADAGGSALAIDLSSRRVRLALGLLRGIAQGQPLTALLGYRMERRLRERDIELTQFILPLRRLFPLNPPAGDSVLAQQEAIAARDVIDVVKLLDKRRGGGNWKQGLTPAPTAAQGAMIDAVVVEIDDLFDAVADLLVAEGVHQLVGGNMERASAALGGMDRQSRPVEPEVVRTPRSGRAFAQRVGALLSEQGPGADWADFPDDARAVGEPYLNAWVARLIGQPKAWGFAAKLVMPAGGERALEPAHLGDLGWSPLTIALLAEPGSKDRPSALQQRLATLFTAQVTQDERDASAELHLLPDPPEGKTAGLAMFEALMAQVRSVIQRHRPATALDIAPPATAAVSGADPATLAKRVDKVMQAQQSARMALSQAVSANTPTAVNLIKALDRATLAGARDAVAASDVAGDLIEQAGQVLQAMTRADARRQSLDDAFVDALATDDDRVEHQVARLKALLGEGFAVLPPFALPTALGKELAASLSDAVALIGKEGAPLHGWISRMAEVRPRLGELASCLIASEMAGTGLSDLKVAQFPHQPGARWIGLPLAPETPARVDLSLVLHAPALDAANPPKTFAGLMSDDWTEAIPASKETTALSFHYDAPAARPPQAMLLAVHPDPAAAGWLPSQVLASVNEAIELTHIRAVRPQDLDMMGSLLPLVYLPDNYTQDVPGIDFSKLRREVASMLPAHLVNVMGKA